MSISERVAYIQKQEGLSASSFSDLLGIQRSGLSHIYSGRNKPSIDFVQKLLFAFPSYNPGWIINGKMPILLPFDNSLGKNEPISPEKLLGAPQDLFSTVESEEQAYYHTKIREDMSAKQPKSTVQEKKMVSSSSLRQIIMVYDDNTFEIIVPQSSK